MLSSGPEFYLKRKSPSKLWLIDLFHAGNPEQEFIISETAKEESYFRVLICTIALGWESVAKDLIMLSIMDHPKI